MDTNRRLVLMIDGDNAQASLLPEILAEVSKYGTLTIRRIYGDWSEPNLKSWKEVLHVYALYPVQQFGYTKGKNATDISLVIDAMDYLHTANIDGFCIASSDSDYTRLATRIREQNMFVMGIGRQLTPRAFVDACNVFVYTENLQAAADEEKTPPSTPAAVTPTTTRKAADNPASPARLEKLIRTAFDSAAQDDGWANLGAMGNLLRQLDPAFDPRTYGHTQLSQLVQAHPKLIEVHKREGKSGNADIYVRLKPASKKGKQSG